MLSNILTNTILSKSLRESCKLTKVLIILWEHDIIVYLGVRSLLAYTGREVLQGVWELLFIVNKVYFGNIIIYLSVRRLVANTGRE